MMDGLRHLLLAMAAGGTALLASPVYALPDFLAAPGGIYEDYTSLGEPRTELPVGALWVQSYCAPQAPQAHQG